MSRKFGGFKVSAEQLAVAQKDEKSTQQKEKKEVKFFLPRTTRN